MAAVQGHLSYRLQDSEREIVSVPLFFNCSTGLLADIQAFATAVDPLFDAVLGAELIKSDIVITRILAGGLKGAPAAGSRNEQSATGSYSAIGSPKHYGLDMPSFIPAGIVNGAIDPTNAAWIAFTAAVVGTTNNCNFQNEHQQNIGSLYRTFESFRKYRRALVRAR